METSSYTGLSVELNNFLDKLWNLQIKRHAKGDAARALAALRPDKQLQEQMLLALEAQAKFHKQAKTELRFIPALGPWIRQMRWMDEIESHAKLQMEQQTNITECYHADCHEIGTNKDSTGQLCCAWHWSQKHADLSHLRSQYRKLELQGKSTQELREIAKQEMNKIRTRLGMTA